jgi:hypothetical protein
MGVLKKEEKESSFNSLVIILAIFIVCLSLAGFLITYIQVNKFKERISGNAVGYINLSIVTEIAINNTEPNINWGEGMVNSSGGFSYTVLETNATGEGNVSGGNWSTSGGNIKTLGWNIVNIGTTNCSIHLASSVGSAHNFFGGTPAYEGYWWKVTDNEIGSCNSGTSNFSSWADANGSLLTCKNLGYVEDKDSLTINVRLWVPYDANITTNKESRFDSVVITGNAAS